jgi:hypothetical protein
VPNDAKLGLFLGISLVVVIGIVFFRADTPAGGGNPAPITAVNSSRESSSPDSATPRAPAE